MVARPVSGPAVPLRKTLGAAGQDREIEVVADAARGAQGHLGVAIDVEGQLSVDLLAAHKEHGNGDTVDGEAAFAERGGQRNFLGGDVDRGHLLAVDADQSAGGDGEFAIGGVDHGGDLGRRDGGVIVPGQHAEAGDGERDHRAAVVQRGQRANEAHGDVGARTGTGGEAGGSRAGGPVAAVATADRGASTRRVGLPVALLCAASKRSMMPGAEGDDAVVRKPP